MRGIWIGLALSLPIWGADHLVAAVMRNESSKSPRRRRSTVGDRLGVTHGEPAV